MSDFLPQRVLGQMADWLDQPRVVFEFPAPTPEQKAEQEARRARKKAEAEAFLESLRAESDPVMREVLDLHAPHDLDWYPDCKGCDTDYYEGGSPSWPCRTVRLLADVANVDIPAHMT